MLFSMTKRGGQLLHGGHVVSEVLREPGPTQSVFDVLAAAVAVTSPGPDVCMLGFAGGGTVAALRALGRTDEVHGVDLDTSGARLFARWARGWQGEVKVHRADAAEFLRGTRGRFAAVIEDLSVQLEDGDVQKPGVSIETLPPLIGRALRPDGVAVLNMLPTAPHDWRHVLAHAAAPFRQTLVVHLAGWENRVLVGAGKLPSAREFEDTLVDALLRLGSELAREVDVRTLPPRAKPASKRR